MIGGKRVLGIIPARGGSKGITRKNLRPIAGKSLLQWTAEAALASRYIDRLVLSTEDDEIAQVGAYLGIEVPFLRPAHLATDSAHVIDVVYHALTALHDEFSYMLLLEPTAPLRKPADIDGCLEALATSGCDYAATVSPSPYRPEWMFYLTDEGGLSPVIGRFDDRPRQQLPPCYVFNGAVHGACVEAFLRDRKLAGERSVAYVMPTERGMDINDQADLDLAEAILLNEGAVPA